MQSYPFQTSYKSICRCSTQDTGLSLFKKTVCFFLTLERFQSIVRYIFGWYFGHIGHTRPRLHTNKLPLFRGHLTCMLSLSLFWSLSACLLFYEMLLGTDRAGISEQDFYMVSLGFLRYNINMFVVYLTVNRSNPPVFLPSCEYISMFTIQACPFSCDRALESATWFDHPDKPL